MAKAPPWHSALASDRKVYHDDDECLEGAEIETRYRRVGTGTRPQCETCRQLAHLNQSDQ